MDEHTIDYDALRKLELAATPGPWHSHSDEWSFYILGPAYPDGRGWDMVFGAADEEEMTANIALIAAARNALPELLADNTELKAKLEAMENGLLDIARWSDAYPLDVFPEPDFVRARKLLEAGGMTIDAISASNMRHVVEGGLYLFQLSDVTLQVAARGLWVIVFDGNLKGQQQTSCFVTQLIHLPAPVGSGPESL